MSALPRPPGAAVAYVPLLADGQVREHARQSHAFWGEGASLENRTEALRRRLAIAGPEVFRMSGFVNDGGQLVASLKRYHFPLRRGDGREVRCLGLGAIFVPAEHRRRGLAERIIRTVLAEEEAAGCTHALLFSDIGIPYYERFGFRAIPGARDFRIPVAARALAPAPSLSTRAATPDELPLLLDAYREACAGIPLCLPRDAASWRLFHDHNALGADHRLLGPRGERLGYFSYRAHDGVLRLGECMLEPRTPGREFWATIDAIARAYGCGEIRGWCGPRWPAGRPADAREESRRTELPALRAPDLRDDELASAWFGMPDHY